MKIDLSTKQDLHDYTMNREQIRRFRRELVNTKPNSKGDLQI